jgi:hypothetical protein
MVVTQGVTGYGEAQAASAQSEGEALPPKQAGETDHCYRVFRPREYPGLTMRTCYDEKEGYYLLRNETGKAMRACWSMSVQFFLNERDGLTLGRCFSPLQKGEEVRFVCYSCKPGQGGPITNVYWSTLSEAETRRRRRN